MNENVRSAGMGSLAGLVGAVAMSAVIRMLGRGVGGGEAAGFNAAADAQRWQETVIEGDLPPTQEAVKELSEQVTPVAPA